MAVYWFCGDISENLDAALNEEISYPKTLVSYYGGAEVWVYNENDPAPTPEQVAERNGTITYYPYNMQE